MVFPFEVTPGSLVLPYSERDRIAVSKNDRSEGAGVFWVEGRPSSSRVAAEARITVTTDVSCHVTSRDRRVQTPRSIPEAVDVLPCRVYGACLRRNEMGSALGSTPRRAGPRPGPGDVMRHIILLWSGGLAGWPSWSGPGHERPPRAPQAGPGRVKLLEK